MRVCSRVALLFAIGLLIPRLLFAQASLAGVVKDTSGAVLPGVTVEAASPALIEKTRSAVTDGTGRYRIENLRPGMYTVTFTLVGFSTAKREGVELTGLGTTTVSIDLRVGAVEETVTVSGETPVVDVQNAARQVVLSERHPQLDPDRGHLQRARRARAGPLRRPAGRQHGPVQLVHVQRARRDPLRRPRQLRGAPAARRAEHRRAAGRRHQLPDRYPERAGSGLHDVGQHGRGGIRRAGDEHHPADRRQYHVGQRLRQLGQQRAAGQQLHRRVEGRGPGRAQPADQAVRLQRRGRRTAQEGQDLVLHDRAVAGQLELHPGLLQPEPGQSERLALQARRRASGEERQDVAQRERTPEHAAQPAQQAQPVLGRTERLQHFVGPVRERRQLRERPVLA